MSKTKELARIALTGAFLFCTFNVFSNILYLEATTLMIICIGSTYNLKDCLLSSLVFGCLLVILQGPTLWNVAYLVIYPSYSVLTSLATPLFKKHNWLLAVWGFILAFLTGMLLDLPFITIDKSITFYYVITGIKTSFIQGVLCSIEVIILYQPIKEALKRIQGEKNEKER